MAPTSVWPFSMRRSVMKRRSRRWKFQQSSKKLGLAGPQDVWIIQKAVYGLTSSPRDWCIYRDEVVPTISWRRSKNGCELEGRFVKTPDDNMWRLEETEVNSKEVHWAGLMSIYVDDLLVTAEDGAAEAAI